MEKIKVAIVLPYFGAGGADKMVAQLAAGMDLEKYTVEVFCVYGVPLKNHLEQLVQDNGVRIHFIKKKRGFSLSAMYRLFRELNTFNPDVIHTHVCLPLHLPLAGAAKEAFPAYLPSAAGTGEPPFSAPDHLQIPDRYESDATGGDFPPKSAVSFQVLQFIQYRDSSGVQSCGTGKVLRSGTQNK